jgi:hypothetical protein
MHYRYKHLLNWQHQQLNKQLDQETIESTDWQATQMAWEEEGKLTSGINTFSGTRTRTFKIKLLHQRLPTASRKKLYDPSYPSDTCLHCEAIETTPHILICKFTQDRLNIILTDLSTQIDTELDQQVVIQDLLH